MREEVLACSGDTNTLLLKAQPADFPYIDSLRKREGDALGFIPKQQYMRKLEERERPGWHDWKHEYLVVTKDNEDYTGFAYGRFSQTKGLATIWQIAIQEDARRWHRALLVADWVEAQALAKGCSVVKARVAVDLEANSFWLAAGYEVLEETTSTFLCHTPSKRRRPLLVYVKRLALPWQDSLFMKAS